MSFSDSVIEQAWKRSEGRCECDRASHGHGLRCDHPIAYHARGMETDIGWEAHHNLAVAEGGSDNLGNCQLLCQSCLKKTRNYMGRKYLYRSSEHSV
jgi:5-methylcytosine-specific restriction endonuclease McrA